jgi:Kef-type K+ transport system membrane component KefB
MPAVDISELVRQTLLILILIIISAKLGGELMGRIGQPPVLGELFMGVLLGNLNLFGITYLNPLKDSIPLQILAQIGGILLLFEVGVESDLPKLLAVGWSSLLVATLGVIAPMALGYIVSTQLIPDASWLTHLFVGGTLTATSVGITARVLKDLGKSDTKEARIILGAAVADDVIGLVVLAVISGLTTAAVAGADAESAVDWMAVLWIVAKACLFLTLAILIGRLWSQRMFFYAARFKVSGTLIGSSLVFCFVIATVASLIGLSPIVGAFAAGAVLEEAHYLRFRERGERTVQELLFPLTTVVVPVFFVLMGFRVDLRSFSSASVLGFAALISAAAVIGKQICGLGVLERGVDRLVIGVGMIPRGEVGLIFAGLGSTLMLRGQPVLSQTTFSALVLMIMLSTFITPPLLKAVFERK